MVHIRKPDMGLLCNSYMFRVPNRKNSFYVFRIWFELHQICSTPDPQPDFRLGYVQLVAKSIQVIFKF